MATAKTEHRSVSELRDLTELPRERKIRQIHKMKGKETYRTTLPPDYVYDAGLDHAMGFQSFIFKGGLPVVIDEPCIIIRPIPNGSD